MTIEEAIGILDHLLRTSARGKSSDSWDAVKMGKQALEEKLARQKKER